MTASFVSNNENCSTQVLRNPSNANWYDDFELGSIDKFTGSVLGTCETFNPDKIISVTITHKGADGWMGKYLKISFTQENVFFCHLNKWIKEADGIPSVTFSCKSI